MSGHMKVQTIGESIDVNIRIPASGSDKVVQGLRMVLELAGLDIDKPEEERTYSAKEVMGEITPGRYLRGLRYREDLTQAELAGKLGITQNFLSDLENDKKPISRKMAEKLAGFFDISYKMFM